MKDRMVELNQQINWFPRMKDGNGKWLENAEIGRSVETGSGVRRSRCGE